ncbi:MAG TPA: ParB/RepB/Spo0J family partition protein, partial [Blastocatellia bacterium]|nr:ParB/RepB/Spo0J family partition protein [Blastocatellia bacterium]
AVSTSSAASPVPVSVQEIPLSKISESKTNPRRQFDETKLAELADNIMQYGVLQAILVRPINKADGFEVVAGTRRYRASKLAGRETIPATVRELTDTQCLELQLIENLQRSDVHELDEAQGYAAQSPPFERLVVHSVSGSRGISMPRLREPTPSDFSGPPLPVAPPAVPKSTSRRMRMLITKDNVVKTIGWRETYLSKDQSVDVAVHRSVSTVTTRPWTIPIEGLLHVVDHQAIDLGNLQRPDLTSKQGSVRYRQPEDLCLRDA